MTQPNTVSGPGWSSMLTGVWMKKQGVTDNNVKGSQSRGYSDFLCRIEQLRPELVTVAVLDWPQLGSAVDDGPLITDLVDTKILLRGGRTGYPADDKMSARAAACWLEHGDPDATLLCLGNPDEISRDTGSMVEPCQSAIEAADRSVGVVMDAIAPTDARIRELADRVEPRPRSDRRGPPRRHEPRGTPYLLPRLGIVGECAAPALGVVDRLHRRNGCGPQLLP